jgi:hypothetical protein
VADSAYPRLAGLGDVERLALGTDVSHTWPPPGCTVVPVAHPEPWGLVVGDFEALPAGEWYVTTLANFVLALPATAAGILARAAIELASLDNLYAGVLGQWPVIFSPIEGRTMRWIKSTIRGTLGAVEQFQFGINWGNPGDDPDLDAAGCQAFAASLAAKWHTVLADTTLGTGGAAWKSQFPGDVHYSEVGVCVCTQTDATAADGSGGNLSQEDPTEWAPINGITGDSGTSASKSLPYEVSACVTLHTNHRGPSGRGRIYMPPNDVVAMDVGGVFDAGHVTACGKAIGKLAEAVTADEGYVPVVVSRRRIILNEVVAISCGIVPDSQRRRRWAQLEAPISAWTKP